MTGTDDEITQLQLSLTSMKSDKAAIDSLQSQVNDSVHQCAEKEKELVATKQLLAEMQTEKLAFVEKVRDMADLLY